MHRARPNDSLHGFMNAFKQFEKKLDKLQADVHRHGNTLAELRLMVANLSDAYLQNTGDVVVQPRTIGVGLQVRTKRRAAIRPLPSKIVANTFQNTKFPTKKASLEEKLFTVKKTSLPTAGYQQRRRHVNADTSWKPTALRQKTEKPTRKRKHHKA